MAASPDGWLHGCDFNFHPLCHIVTKVCLELVQEDLPEEKSVSTTGI